MTTQEGAGAYVATPLMQQWIEQYYKGGWAVVPLPPRMKSRPPEGLTGAAGVNLDKDELLSRLADNANIGVRVPENVIGIDVDAYGEKVGETTLGWLEYGPPGSEQDALGELPATFWLTSRSDGVSGIRFYRVPAGLDWSDPGGDIEVIRHTWRYAVAAPSVHPEGRTYQWLTPEGVPCGVPKVTDLPELPDKWVQALQKKRGERTGAGLRTATGEEMLAALSRFKTGDPCSCVRDWGQRALDAAMRKSGGAHNALLGPVMSLVRQGLADCVGAGEALHAVRSAYIALDPTVHPGDFARIISDTIPKAQMMDAWFCTDVVAGLGEVLTAPAEPEPETATQASAEGDPNPYGWVDFNSMNFWHQPPPRYYIPRMLVETQVCTIYSAGGIGKSLLAQDIVAGLVWRGRIFGIEIEKAPVVYIDRENSSRGLLKRLTAMGISERDADQLKERLHYSLLGAWPALDSREGSLALYKEMKRTGARLLILDTLSKVVDGEENSNDTWKGLHQHTMIGLKRMGITVLQLDHTGKDADKGQRGGSSKHDNADAVWHLTATPDGSYVQLHRKKDRDGDYDELLFLERREVPRLEHVFVDSLPAAVAYQISREAKIQELIDAMDLLKLDSKMGRGKVGEALTEAGMKFSNNDLAEAVSQRKNRDAGR